MNQQTTTPPPEKRSTLQGWIVRFENDQERAAAIDLAFDYRGDVTLHTAQGQVIQGYVFDRKADCPQPYVRVIPADGGPKMHVLYKDITQLEFSGKDTAAGKSWETWVKNYRQKKAMGQAADLHPEPLD